MAGTIGIPVTPLSRMIHHLLESSLGMRKCLRRASKLHPPTYVVSPLLAVLAVLTRQADLQSYVISNSKTGHARPNCHDATTRFMTERERFADDDIPVAVVIKIMQVGAA